MAVTKRPVAKKRAVPSRTTSKKTSTNTQQKKSFRFPNWGEVKRALAWPFVTPYRGLRKRREQSPHKSFIRTRRRDKVKTPKMEGYIAFPWYVLRVLWNRKWVYIRLIGIFFALSVLFIGALQTDNISSINGIFDTINSETNILNPVMRAGATVLSSVTGSLNNNLSDIQYVYISILIILGLLTVVWLVRHQLAGDKVRMRDGLYNAATPIVAEYALVGVGILQLLPVALAVVVYISLTSSGIIDGGIEAGMFVAALFLMAVLTLYFMTTTLFALFIASIPGTYPLKAYRAARQIVAGQRLRLLLRLVWMVVVILIAWFIVLVPTIIIVNSIGAGDSWAIPIAYQLVVITSIVYATAYGYLLYRRMIDEPTTDET